jgi:hypothetical protein
MKWQWIVVLGIIGIFVLIGGSWAWRYYTAPIEGRVGAQEQIQSKEMMITAYNHFYDLYAKIQSYEVTLQAFNTQLAQVTDKERERVLANIAGVTSQRARDIAQYNADAKKDYTIGQFRDKGLPYQLNNEGKEK